jgi:hypothetical protein
MNEQMILDGYYEAADRSEVLRKDAKARPARGTADWLRRDLSADRDHFARMLAAADKALAQVTRRLSASAEFPPQGRALPSAPLGHGRTLLEAIRAAPGG